MPNEMGKGTPRKEASDAAGEVARTSRDTDVGRKNVRDAAEAGRETIRSGGEAIGKTTERTGEAISQIAGDASQQIRQALADAADQRHKRLLTRHALGNACAQ